ncbi:hypothetical protein [Microbispora hainanensis]|uniref:Uncharacterized protein n=1 Tax=Microbispora hainanensis TaxID=568844 RepID=A0A544YZS0_9ACTN|nr:hypothetical protein [Microbispora hainanensis]TQS22215.1 hypothetical protein FLX08_09615 [Microbispora hainanensis]
MARGRPGRARGRRQGRPSSAVVIRRREVETQAATGDIVRQADKAQYATGSCLDAAYRHRTVRLSDRG